MTCQTLIIVIFFNAFPCILKTCLYDVLILSAISHQFISLRYRYRKRIFSCSFTISSIAACILQNASILRYLASIISLSISSTRAAYADKSEGSCACGIPSPIMQDGESLLACNSASCSSKRRTSSLAILYPSRNSFLISFSFSMSSFNLLPLSLSGPIIVFFG